MAESGLSKPPPSGDHEPAPKPKRYWWRFSLGSVIIVVAVAAATSASILLYIGSIATALSHHNIYNAKLHRYLSKVNGGEPENILILGSDKRANLAEDPGRSDTTMLLRLDPDREAIAVMSIPRDLKVEIPGYGTDKFNAAYTVGGPKLTLQVVKELTGLQINHVVNVDFQGFADAVDAIGCVYVDVDHDYFHSNEGLYGDETYSEIDINAGYQRLCGEKALQYVRYRHTDTDIVRSARQQNFLGQVRHQVSPLDLITDNHNLIDILAEYTTSSITEGSELLELLDLLYELKGAEVNQVHFPAELGPSYVYANEDEVHHAAKEFLGEAGYDSHRFPEEKPEAKKLEKKKKAEKKQASKGKKKHKKKHHTPPGGDELVPASEAGQEMGEKVARQVGGGFPVFYPTRLPEGAVYQEDNSYEHVVNPWVYHLRDKEKVRHGAYRMIGVYQPEYELNYFGVQGIQGWEDPPILDDPTETKTVNGREYSIYTDSGQIKLVAWHRGEDSYWISNSLQQSLTNEQMMGIAESSQVILPKRKTAKNGSKSE